MTITAIFTGCFLIRLVSLFKSIANERKLKQQHAVEYGKKNSLILTFAHIGFYIACITEANYYSTGVNTYTVAGIALFLFSMVMLWWVIFTLGSIWTVKLIISPDQVVKTNFLFKYIRHPNYYLNVLPELISIALICNAWYVLCFGLPLYLVPLVIRIVQEEKIMKETFQEY